MIELESILNIENDLDYKVHFAVYNYEEEPLIHFLEIKMNGKGGMNNNKVISDV